jgi:hypothetical protein
MTYLQGKVVLLGHLYTHIQGTVDGQIKWDKNDNHMSKFTNLHRLNYGFITNRLTFIFFICPPTVLLCNIIFSRLIIISYDNK